MIKEERKELLEQYKWIKNMQYEISYNEYLYYGVKIKPFYSALSSAEEELEKMTQAWRTEAALNENYQAVAEAAEAEIARLWGMVELGLDTLVNDLKEAQAEIVRLKANSQSEDTFGVRMLNTDAS